MNAIATERSVIGCLLCCEEAMSILTRAGVDESWFHNYEARELYALCTRMFVAGTPINLVTVHERTEANAEGDKPDLESYVDASTSVAFLESHIKDLDAARHARIGLGVLEEGVEEIKTAKIDNVLEILTGISSKLVDLRDNRDTRSLGEIGTALIDSWRAETRADNMLSWPLSRLTDLLGYITDEFIFIAALESVGKTAFALNIMAALAQANVKTSLASLESKKAKVVQRLIAIIGNVNTVSLRNKTAIESAYESAYAAAKRLDELPIRITDSPMNTDQLLAWAKCEKKAGSKLLIVDNMRHIRPAQKYASPVEQFRDLSVRLKWIRDDAGLPLIVLHHLTDDLDVSWSKDIRRDADVLLYLIENETQSVNPTYENQWTEKSVVDFEVKKNREGMRGFKVTAEFDKKHQRFI